MRSEVSQGTLPLPTTGAGGVLTLLVAWMPAPLALIAAATGQELAMIIVAGGLIVFIGFTAMAVARKQSGHTGGSSFLRFAPFVVLAPLVVATIASSAGAANALVVGAAASTLLLLALAWPVWQAGRPRP